MVKGISDGLRDNISDEGSSLSLSLSLVPRRVGITRHLGFALPSILVSSIVMLMVLMSAIQAVVASRNALMDQFYAQLAKEAAASGTKMAVECLALSQQTVTWTDAQPLTPATDCTGTVQSGQSAYVLSTDRYKTTFKVPAPTMTQNSGVYNIASEGTLERIRTSNGDTWSTQQSDQRSYVALPILVSVDGGYNHGIAVDASREVIYSWGGNGAGQFGNGTITDSTIPTVTVTRQQLDGSYIQQVIGGGDHTLALTQNGRVYAWGSNAYGQVGDGTTTNKLAPVAVDTSGTPMAGKKIVWIGAGFQHSLAIDEDGVTYSWGMNANGQLGDGTTTNRLKPVLVDTSGTPMAGKRMVKVKSNSHSNTTLALDSNGDVYGWGNNGNTIGDGTSVTRSKPVAVATSGTPMSGVRIIDIETATGTSYFLGNNSKLYGTGTNTYGQLAQPRATLENTNKPVEIPTAGTPIAGKTITAVSADGFHALALTDDGKVYGWGWNHRGQIGAGIWQGPNNGADGCPTIGGSSATPFCAYSIQQTYSGSPMASRKVIGISTSDRSSYAVASDGTAWAWGDNTCNNAKAASLGYSCGNASTPSNAPIGYGTLGVGMDVLARTAPTQMVFRARQLNF